MVINLYRVFEFYTHVVWSKHIPDEMGALLDNRCFLCLHVADSETTVPVVYTKEAVPHVALDLASLKTPEYEEIAKIVEAYPASYHHAPHQEIGIGLGTDQNPFGMWPCWKYYKLSGIDCSASIEIMSAETIADRHRLKKRRPYGL